MKINEMLQDVQRRYFDQHGIKVDVHYREDKGALLVPEGAALIPQNVVAAIPDYVFRFGVFININFE